MNANAPTPQALEPALLERPLRGRNLVGSNLAEELGEAPALLVFLRHYG